MAFANSAVMALALFPRVASAAPGATSPYETTLAGHAVPSAATDADAPAPVCSGDYADELSVVAPHVRDFERDPQNQYSYCLRTSAVYECLSYASDGTVRRERKTVVAHGTGFAYRRSGGDTYVLTNDHVASWPAVSSEDHPVDDVPAGCKLISDSLKIVDDEDDDYEGNDVALTRVASDPTLDVAIAKTKVALKTIPYRIGHSAALHVGNAVAVHGFPLGAFAATNLGKVVNAYDHDTERDWDHLDFVVDALLSPGNSGSPVLAVSCRTGEYELVGIYHAGYTRGSALNVVVAIDQVKDLMTTLKRAPHVTDASRGNLGADDRHAVQEQFTSSSGLAGASFFPFGPLVATGRLLPSGALSFEVYSRGFPLKDERLLVVEDLPPTAVDGTGAFGETGRIYIGNTRGLRSWSRATLDGDAQAALDRIVVRLRAGAVSAARYREVDATTSKGHKRRRQIEKALDRQGDADKDAAQSLLDLSERLGPKVGEKVLAYDAALQTLRATVATESAVVPQPVAAGKTQEGP